MIGAKPKFSIVSYITKKAKFKYTRQRKPQDVDFHCALPRLRNTCRFDLSYQEVIGIFIWTLRLMWDHAMESK